MPVVTRFEDLQVWQRARALNRAVYQLTTAKPLARDFRFVDQARGCSISIMNNIAAGFERFRRAEFLQFLSIAKGSVGELRSMLYAALDVGYIDQTYFDDLMEQSTELSRSLGSFRRGLERSTPKTLVR